MGSWFIGEKVVLLAKPVLLSAKFHFYRRTANICNKSLASLPTNQAQTQKNRPARRPAQLNQINILYRR